MKKKTGSQKLSRTWARENTSKGQGGRGAGQDLLSLPKGKTEKSGRKRTVVPKSAWTGKRALVDEGQIRAAWGARLRSLVATIATQHF